VQFRAPCAGQVLAGDATSTDRNVCMRTMRTWLGLAHFVGAAGRLLYLSSGIESCERSIELPGGADIGSIRRRRQLNRIFGCLAYGTVQYGARLDGIRDEVKKRTHYRISNTPELWVGCQLSGCLTACS